MFTKTLEQIFTKNALSSAFDEISANSLGLDEISYADFKKNFSQNATYLMRSLINGTYTPEPLRKINIPKENRSGVRPIGISSIKDKLVQRVLYSELNPYFDETFLSNSYAYRPNKSTYKAINRASNFINEGYYWILKADVKDFFESIDHSKLLQILQTGGFLKRDFKEHKIGVNQGDILSPMLSNIYLDLMDRFINKTTDKFVRYADDFIICFGEKDEATEFEQKLDEFLKLLNLSLNKEKTKVVNINDGFVFLGVRFFGKNRCVDNDKIQKIISNLHSASKEKSNFIDYIDEINAILLTLKNYYLKIIPPNSPQITQIKEHLIDSLSQKIALHKQNKSINSKKDFTLYLEKIDFGVLFNQNEIKDKITLAITKGYDKYLSQKSYDNDSRKINQKRNFYATKIASDSTLHINQIGVHLGLSKNKFVIKQYGKIYKEFPISKISRIIVDSEHISLSSAVIWRCTREKIHIDFIDKHYVPYATLLAYNSVSTQTTHKQAMLLNTPAQLYIAMSLVEAKIKKPNQLPKVPKQIPQIPNPKHPKTRKYPG